METLFTVFKYKIKKCFDKRILNYPTFGKTCKACNQQYEVDYALHGWYLRCFPPSYSRDFEPRPLRSGPWSLAECWLLSQHPSPALPPPVQPRSLDCSPLATRNLENINRLVSVYISSAENIQLLITLWGGCQRIFPSHALST